MIVVLTVGIVLGATFVLIAVVLNKRQSTRKSQIISVVTYAGTGGGCSFFSRESKAGHALSIERIVLQFDNNLLQIMLNMYVQPTSFRNSKVDFK